MNPIRRLFAWLGRHIITGCDSRWPAATDRYPVQHDDQWDLRPLPKPDPYEAARFAAYGLDPRHNARRSEAARRYWADLDQQLDRAMAEIAHLYEGEPK